MILMDGQAWLEVRDMERAGIPYDTVKKARARQSRGWTIVDNPADRRQILVHYASLKPSMKQRVDQVLGTELATQGVNAIQELVKPRPADVEVLEAHTLPDGTHLPHEAVVRYARACAYLHMLCNTPPATRRALGYTTQAGWYRAVAACLEQEQVDLPRSKGALQRKQREYREAGPQAMVSGNWCNANRRVIEGELEDWLVSQYALPTKPPVEVVAQRYQQEAGLRGWPALSTSALHTHLHRPEVKRRWYLGRHGAAEWGALYSHEVKRTPPSCRDAMWCSDGTKLNLFYRTTGKVPMAAKMQVYVVMDVYSEMILGWSLDTNERFTMQQAAMRMALQASRHKPQQLLYDGQGGHKRGEAQDFFSRATALHFPSRPRNAKAKPVESLIGRLQMQVMRGCWHFTGQNIQAKRLDSKPNMEFITAHLDSLPGVEQLPALVEDMINDWNNRPHPKLGISRQAAYTGSSNPQAAPLHLLDMVNLFWHTTARPVRYRKGGLTLQVGEQRHDYEVYTDAGLPDEEFRMKYTGQAFRVKYDLEDMGLVMLYLDDPQGLRFVAAAQAKRTVAMAVRDLQPGDRAWVDHSLDLRKRELARTGQELKAITDRSGIDAETLIQASAHYTVDKAELARAEALVQQHAQAVADEEDDDEPEFNPYANI